jgi:hypothetical protein
MAEPAEPAGISMTISAAPESDVFVGKSGAVDGPIRAKRKAPMMAIKTEAMISCFFIVVSQYQ